MTAVACIGATCSTGTAPAQADVVTTGTAVVAIGIAAVATGTPTGTSECEWKGESKCSYSESKCTEHTSHRMNWVVCTQPYMMEREDGVLKGVRVRSATFSYE